LFEFDVSLQRKTNRVLDAELCRREYIDAVRGLGSHNTVFGSTSLNKLQTLHFSMIALSDHQFCAASSDFFCKALGKESIDGVL